jgi:hypothetical protein
MTSAEDVGREVDDALEAFTTAQLTYLRASRRLLSARARFTETTQPASLATIHDLRSRAHD